ncbi:hypothetical protein [Caballeronia hypogeia]|uniref:hypothetical protein n=1 Tax=Caballeronia hypogeia TaxID=1777140 RepID=UPI000772704F|nr:hypothetical protein [Caballeronia hypogeia]
MRRLLITLGCGDAFDSKDFAGRPARDEAAASRRRAAVAGIALQLLRKCEGLAPSRQQLAALDIRSSKRLSRSDHTILQINIRYYPLGRFAND